MKKYKVKFYFNGRYYEIEVSAQTSNDAKVLIENQYPGASAITVTQK